MDFFCVCFRLIEVITESQPTRDDKSRLEVYEVDLNKQIGASISDIQTAYAKMFSLCVPGMCFRLGCALGNF